jgi:uncharacterized protein
MDTGWASPTGLVFAGEPKAEIVLHRIDDETAALQGHLQATVVSACARCGDTMECVVDETFTYTFKADEASDHLPEEFECSDEDCEIVYLEEPIIDIDDVLAEQLILSVPEKMLCDERCRGLCPHCGASLNYEKCSCTGDHSDSPFAVLQQLKK